MRHWKPCMALVIAAVAGGTLPPLVDAMAIMPQPLATRVMAADVVAVGKVIALEPQDVQVMNVTYRIAIVQINDALHGAKGAKTVRVGFNPPPPAVPVQPGVVRPFIRRRPTVQLQEGQEGLFLLNKDAKQKFYTLGIGGFVSSQNNPGFDKDLGVAKTAAKVMDDPQAALKAKDADTRLLGAAVLVQKYRPYGNPAELKAEPIDPAESKLIMHALAGANWNVKVDFGATTPNPSLLFNRLGISKVDGFMPAPGANFQATMQAWLRDHADTYRIQRLVPKDTK